LPIDQSTVCSTCGRPLPGAGTVCLYCAESQGTFHVRPLFLVLVLLISTAFATATVFAARFYESKQQQLGQMWFGRGQAALAAGAASAAVLDFRNALYYSHDDPNYRLRLAEALLAANRIEEARSYLLTLWQDEPSNSTINLQLARLAARAGETQAAMRYYHGAIYGLWPAGDAAALRRQTRLELIHYLLRLHDATQADAELIALTPELPPSAAEHDIAGRLFLQADDPSRALAEFQTALHLDSRLDSAWLGAGEAAFKLTQYRDAARYLERASRSSPHPPQAQELLATSRLILSWNPYAQGVSARQRASRVVQAYRQAGQRLDECAAARNIEWQPGGVPPASSASNAAPPNPPAANRNGRTSEIIAAILGRARPGAKTGPAAPANGNANPAQLQQLHQQYAALQPRVRVYQLERDPQLADDAMALVSQIEVLTAQQCGTPKGPDLALLLLSHKAEER